MQYKIPVQIENEDTIFLGLSLRQLGIIVVGGGLGYTIFTRLKNAGIETGIALIPLILCSVIAIIVALFRNAEMTFLPFILNLIRLNLNSGTRAWSQGESSYGPLDVGHVTSFNIINQRHEEKAASHEVFSSIEDKLSKL